MSFKPYQDYTDSGLNWLGKLPAHWRTRKLKDACVVFPSNIDKKTYEDQTPVLLCNYTDVYHNEVIVSNMDFMEATATEDQIQKFTLRKGDTIITKDSETADDIGISAYVANDLEGVVCGYHLTMVRPKDDSVGLYNKYFFDTHFAKASLEVSANGLTRVGLSQYAIDNINIPHPPFEEQTVISEFLQIETGKIDSLISEQKKLIELLREKRQAAISHAVTKGINPNVKLKDSGVMWLGNIPQHWEVIQSRRLFLERNQKAESGERQLTASQKYGVIYQDEFMTMEGQKVVQVIHGADILKHAEPNDFVISMRSFQGGIEWCGYSGSISSAYVMLTPNNNVYSNFFKYLFKSKSYIQALQSTTNLVRDGQALRFSNFSLVDLPLIPIEEQREISEHLDKVLSKFDALVKEAYNYIDLLVERRSTLISAAVNGQIDVRNFNLSTEET